MLSGPIDEFVDAMGRLANYMKQQNSRETQARGMRELEAINGEKGNITSELNISNCKVFLRQIKPNKIIYFIFRK